MKDFEHHLGGVDQQQADMLPKIAGGCGELSKSAINRRNVDHQALHGTLQEIRNFDPSSLPYGASRSFRFGRRGGR